MSQTKIPVRPDKGTLVYSAVLLFGKVTDYGIALQDVGQFLQGGGVAPVRVDVEFSGETTEGIVSGTITGTDYLNCQSDGTLSLTLFERIETSLGAVSFQATGTAIGTDDPNVMRFTQDAKLLCHAPDLIGLNGLKLRGEGHVYLAKGEVRLSLYVV